MEGLNRIRVSKNFFLDELVDPHTYFTELDYGLSKLDFRIIHIVQRLRDKKGSSIFVNNWWQYLEKLKSLNEVDVLKFLKWCNAKSYVHIWRGYRSALCKIGASNSAHKKGFAADPKGDEKAMMQIVRDNAKEFYNLGLRRLEDISITKGWLHIDTWEHNTKPNSIRVVDRTKCTETIYF